jgi:hypothetical protein
MKERILFTIIGGIEVGLLAKITEVLPKGTYVLNAGEAFTKDGKKPLMQFAVIEEQKKDSK